MVVIISTIIPISGGSRISLRGGMDLRRGHSSVKMNAKTKELGPIGGRAPGTPPRSANANVRINYNEMIAYEIQLRYVIRDKIWELFYQKNNFVGKKILGFCLRLNFVSDFRCTFCELSGTNRCSSLLWFGDYLSVCHLVPNTALHIHLSELRQTIRMILLGIYSVSFCVVIVFM